MMTSYLFIYNQFRHPDENTYAIDVVPYITNIICINSLLMVIGFQIYILIIPIEKLYTNKMKRKFGYLFNNFKPGEKVTLWYYLIFIFRRIALCLIFLRMQGYPCLQIEVLFIVN